MFCDLHKAIVVKMAEFLIGTTCRVKGCTANIKSKMMCAIHNEDENAECADNDKELVATNSSEDEKVQIEQELRQVVDILVNEMGESKKKIIYIGLSMLSGIDRCVIRSHDSKRGKIPINYVVRDILQVDSAAAGTYCEYYVIKCLAERLGDTRLYNNVGGGGGINGEASRYYLYSLTWLDSEDAIDGASQEKSQDLKKMFVYERENSDAIGAAGRVSKCNNSVKGTVIGDEDEAILCLSDVSILLDLQLCSTIFIE